MHKWQTRNATAVIANKNGDDCGMFHDGDIVKLIRPALGDLTNDSCWVCRGIKTANNVHSEWKVPEWCLDKYDKQDHND